MEGRAFRHGDIVRFPSQIKLIMFPTSESGRHTIRTGQEDRWNCPWRTHREEHKVWWIGYQTRILWVRVPISLPSSGRLTPFLGTGLETIVKFVVYTRPLSALVTDDHNVRLWI
jgi:hypothetical protein